jgi:hypothetical protein
VLDGVAAVGDGALAPLGRRGKSGGKSGGKSIGKSNGKS